MPDTVSIYNAGFVAWGRPKYHHILVVYEKFQILNAYKISKIFFTINDLKRN